MKIFTKKEFLKLPFGTFFAKGVPFNMDGFCIKGESLKNDFFYTNLVSIDAFDSGELADRQYEMLEKGTSYPLMLNEMRDGIFSDDDIFLVFEKQDLQEIKNQINRFLGE